MAETQSPATAGSATASAVAPGPATVPAPKPAALAHAAQSVPNFGGNRGGKPRKDGLAPGSAQAQEADRKKERERGQNRRATAAKLVEPAPLPSAAEGGNGAAIAPSPGQIPGVVAAPGQAFVPWRPELVRELSDLIIDCSEESRVQKYVGLAADAKLPELIVKEIKKDAAYPSLAKGTLKAASPQAACDALNELGISAKHQHLAAVAGAIAAIWFQGTKLDERFAELIKATKKNEPEP